MKIGKKSIRLGGNILSSVSEKLLPFFSEDFNAISVSVKYAFLYCTEFDKMREIPKEKIVQLAKEIPSSKEVKRFCIYDSTLDWLSTYYGTDTITHTVKCCLKEVELQTKIQESLMPLINPKYCTNESLKPLPKNDLICARMGNKSSNIGEWVTDVINEMRIEYNRNYYASVFAGTGNELLHMLEFENEYLNDKDGYMINLLKVIREHPFELIEKMANVPVDEKTHKKYLDMIYGTKKENGEGEGNDTKFRYDKNIERTIEKALAYLYIILTQYQGNPKSFNSKCSENVIKNRIPVIARASVRLQKVKIKWNDFKTFIKSLISEYGSLEDFILYWDFPYIGTEKYYSVCKSQKKKRLSKDEKAEKCMELHTAFRKAVFNSIRKKAIVVISYRATISNSSYLSENEVRDILDKLYEGKGFFIGFMRPERSKTQIEIIISNVEFKNSVIYNNSIDSIIKTLKI